MSQESTEIPLVSQVVVRTLEALRNHSEFDEATRQRLEQLAKAGNLGKYESVVVALSSTEEEPCGLSNSE